MASFSAALPQILAGAGAFSIIMSFAVTERLDVIKEVEAETVPVRATLKEITVHKWIPGGDNWGAFGTFTFEAAGEQRTADGSLAPKNFKSRHRRKTSREEAESFVPAWTVGRTYDGFWVPSHPDGIFFHRTSSQEITKSSQRFQIAGGGLIAAAIGLALLRRRRTSNA